MIQLVTKFESTYLFYSVSYKFKSSAYGRTWVISWYLGPVVVKEMNLLPYPQTNLQMGLLKGRDALLAEAESELESWKGHCGHHKKEQFLMNIQARALLRNA